MEKKLRCTSKALAGIIGIGLLFFWQSFYPRMNLTITNILVKIVFWFIVLGCIVFISALVFLPHLLYRKWKELVLIGLSTIMALIVTEVVLRFYDRRPLRFAPHPYLNYIGSPNYISQDGENMHNSRGFRGPEIQLPKPSGRMRIAILGGSTVYEDLVKNWRYDFARMLEKSLRELVPHKDIEVINAGLAAWDSWEDLVNLEFRLLDLDIDLIILYEGTNDVRARFVRPDTYRGDNSGSKKQWDRRLCLDIRCLKIGQWITGVDDFALDVDAPTVAPYPKANEYNAILRTTPKEALEKNRPVYTERNIRNMIAVARENGIDVLLATWAWSDELDDYAAIDHYQMGFRQHNELVIRIGKLKNIPVYDFAVEMPKDRQYWADGRHNNEVGVALKGKLFARYIVENNILPN